MTPRAGIRVRLGASLGAALLTAIAAFVLAHLVEPGRAKYQRRLSQVVVTRLQQYGLAR